MKPVTKRMPRWLTYTLLGGLTVVLVLMPFHAFLSTWGGTSIGPLWLWKSWKELVLTGLFVLVVGWLALTPAAARQLFSRRFVWVLVAYVAASLIVGVAHASNVGADAFAAGLAMDFRYLLAGIVAYAAFYFSGLPERWLTRASIYIAVVGVVVALLGIVQVLFVPADFLSHFGYNKETTIAPYTMIDDNPNLLRAFATLRGPNDFGAFLILPLLLVAAWLWRKPVLASLGVFAIIWALLLTSSRSAWLGAAVALAVFGLLLARRKLSRKQLVSIVVAVAILGAGLLTAAVSVPSLRMAVFHSSPGDPSLTEGSTDEHVAATFNGVERVANEPFGCGVGCAGPASYYGDSPRISENYFVQIAEETGVSGLVLFVVFVSAVAIQLYWAKYSTTLAKALFAALCGYIVIGMLLHVWADDPLTITWWTLAGAVLGYNKRQLWKKSKDS
jgi:hypothetical protein